MGRPQDPYSLLLHRVPVQPLPPGENSLYGITDEIVTGWTQRLRIINRHYLWRGELVAAT